MNDHDRWESSYEEDRAIPQDAWPLRRAWMTSIYGVTFGVRKSGVYSDKLVVIEHPDKGGLCFEKRHAVSFARAILELCGEEN